MLKAFNKSDDLKASLNLVELSSINKQAYDSICRMVCSTY